MTASASDTAVQCIACEGRQVDSCRVANGYEIVSCRSCGLRFVPPARLAQVDYDDLYGDAGEYDLYRREAQALAAGERYGMVRARRMSLAEIRRRRPHTLLDVGCGVGGFLKQVEALGIRTWGLDLSARAIELARGYLRADLHCGVLGEGVFPGRQFDVVTAWEVLEHVSGAIEFMSTIFGRLSPGGRLFLSTPNCASTWVWNDMENDPRSRPPVHVAFWDAACLDRFLVRMGFEAVRVRRVSVHYPAAVWPRGRAARARVALDALLRPSQRRTLLAAARKPMSLP
jgi:SAM-dependent methyltransferase